MLPVAVALACILALIPAPWRCASAEESAPGVEWLLDDGKDASLLPLDEPDIALPAQVQEARHLYRAGSFRRAAEILQRYRDMELPDGELDYICLALAEAYRMLGVADAASANYAFVIERFPRSDKAPACAYRLFEYACDDGLTSVADSMFNDFKARHQSHPLYASVLYRMARLMFSQRRYAEATEILGQIPQRSSRFTQAQFLGALCQLKLKNRDRALMQLEYVRKNGPPQGLGGEALIVIGDMLYEKGETGSALKYYQGVDKEAPRFDFARVRAVRCLIDMKESEKGLDGARKYLAEQPNGRYAFEMISLMEEAYRSMGDSRRAAKAGSAVYRQVMNARISFWIYEELNRMISMSARWRQLLFRAQAMGDRPLQQSANEHLLRAHALERRYWELLRDMYGARSVDIRTAASNLAVRTYLGFLRDSIGALEDSAERIGDSLRIIGTADSGADSSISARVARLRRAEEGAKTRIAGLEREQNIVTQAFQARGSAVMDEEGPAKFIDWSFMRYQKKKEDLTALSDRRKKQSAGAKKDSAAAGGEVAQKFGAMDRDKMAAEITRDRNDLLQHVQTMLAYYPRNRYNSDILYRLAELLYDQASEDFDTRLRAYESAMARGSDSAGLKFPEFDLSKVIAVYNRITVDYPTSDVADDAAFYRALALQKAGDMDRANEAFQELIRAYPQSEFYVEANMNVGRYYFEHPRIGGNKGYKLAEDAFREVLYYRDHPQYVQALYNLGWCYYMQDQYDEAIAVFKYLVEEVELDFDPARAQEKQVLNPLLRGEAIDYIAISFDEENKLDDAVKFLQLVGNFDYAALVLQRMGELREEMHDNKQALLTYQRLLAEYPMAANAPDVAARRIAILESMGMSSQALEERVRFFTAYARGSAWSNGVASRDSSLLPHVDSMAISNGLYAADFMYRRAQATGDSADFVAAARGYQAVVKASPGNPRAADAQWNVAVILQQNLKLPREAYGEFLACSRMKEVDPGRREQAALNAIAIVQKSLPPDSAVQPGTMEPVAVRLVEAVENYVTLFPKGKAFCDVLVELGAVYFNRKMYANAAKVYARIIELGPLSEDYYRAQFLLGKSRFAEENWPSASKAFEEVAAKSLDAQRREEARKLLLQSEYLKAKQFLTAGSYEKAAAALLSIEDRFPGSQYGDVVLFSAAEAYEKMEKWADAPSGYLRLVKNYPSSKLAPDALFNAAGDYEKSSNFEKAAEAYETLIARYPSSDKTKDAMFNLGFCYEKLGKFEMMAAINERYTSMFPGEKDAKAMLLRSADFYFKAAMLDKALGVYRNFARRFGMDPECAQAYYMIGRISQEQNDRVSALASYSQAEQQHDRLVKAGGAGNLYFAAEAAMATGNLLRGDFLAVKFDQTGPKLKELQQRKSLAMSDAAKAYARVMQYRSDKLFEAGYRIGEMLEDYAQAWNNQKRENADPVKAAVTEKDINTAASTLLQKTFAPYKKVIELARGLDSLGPEQKRWVELAQSRLADNYLQAGVFLVNAVGVMYSAPIPKEIQKMPLHFFQYRRQLTETLEPMKAAASAYFLTAYKDLMVLNNETVARKCIDRFCQVNYLMGEDYEKLSEKILKNDFERPPNMTPDEEDELNFQLEDVLFELQDKAIFAYEDARKRILDARAQESPWFARIMASLARLSPDVYGKSVFQTVTFSSGEDWALRSDSVAGWNGPAPSLEGWSAVRALDAAAPVFPLGKPRVIGAPVVASIFLRKDLFINGLPRDARLYLAASGKFKLYVNGTQAANDTAGNRALARVDSFTNVAKLFKGGDNAIAVHAYGSAADNCVAIAVSLLVDTSQHFKSEAPRLVPGTEAVPRVDTAASQAGQPVSTAPAQGDSVPAQQTAATQTTAPVIAGPGVARGSPGSETPASSAGETEGWTVQQFRTSKSVQAATQDYAARESATTKDLKRERVALQRVQAELEETDARIRGVQEETSSLRREMETMQGTK